MTEGSGTSAQILGLLASIKLTAEDELLLFDEATTLLEDFELTGATEDATRDETEDRTDETAADEIGAEERAEEAGVTLPQGAPLSTGTSAFAAPLVP